MPQIRQPIQGTQPTGISQTSRIAQNQQAPAQPMQTTGAPEGTYGVQQTPPVKKKSKWWIWLIIIILIILAFAAYIIFKPF
jgi:hypothetical protein